MSTNIRATLVVFVAVFSLGSSAQGEFDFVLLGTDCKMVIAYTVLSDDSLKIVEGDTPVLFCKRNSKKIECDVTHNEEIEKTERRKYEVLTDSPPLLLFQAENGSENAYIDTVENAGSYTSRLIGEKYMGHKVCSTAFFTYDQFMLFQEGKID